MTSRVFAFVGVVLALAIVAPASLAQTTSPTFGQGAFRPGDGITPPQLVKQVSPKYTSDALHRKVAGDVEVEAVVKADGTVGDVRLVRGLDAGLDAEAVKAARLWVFTPGTDRDGKAAPVIVTMVLSFLVSGQVADDDFAKGACRPPAAGVTAPKLVLQVEPKYTRDAMQAKIEGEVTVEAVVGTDGTVTRSRVVKSLDKIYGLDQEALKAASQWTFEPDSGKCQDVAAPVLVTFVLTFRLH